MHHNQISAFCALDAIPERKLITKPFTLNGHTYATDGKMMIRWPGHMTGFSALIPEMSDKSAKFAASVMAQFDFFKPQLLKRELKPLSSVAIEPIIHRDLFRDGGEIAPDADPIFSCELGEAWVCRLTPVKIGEKRAFDARRLLFIRQHLDDVHYIEEDDVTEFSPMHFVFGGDEQGEGVLMPVRWREGAQLHSHWNGVKFCPGW